MGKSDQWKNTLAMGLIGLLAIVYYLCGVFYGLRSEWIMFGSCLLLTNLFINVIQLTYVYRRIEKLIANLNDNNYSNRDLNRNETEKIENKLD